MLINNSNQSKGFKVTVSFLGLVNGKIDGSQGDNKQVEVKAGGGRAEIFVRKLVPDKEFKI